MNNIMNMYTDYVTKIGDRLEPIEVITKKYDIQRAMYPGSYVHITPSFVVPEMLYVDTDKKAKKFFIHMEDIKQYVENNKKYSKETTIDFQGTDFYKPINCTDNYYDLLISLYAGFISQACKRYLKIGGMVLANDSHGDATLAYIDKDYEFIGVVLYKSSRYKIDCTQNEIYFKMKKDKAVDMEQVKSKMKGPKYAHQSEYYLFKRIR